MKQGYYIKVDGKWYITSGVTPKQSQFPVPVDQINELFFYGVNFRNLIEGDGTEILEWQYSNQKETFNGNGSSYIFTGWINKSPSEEDLILLEMMFP